METESVSFFFFVWTDSSKDIKMQFEILALL